MPPEMRVSVSANSCRSAGGSSGQDGTFRSLGLAAWARPALGEKQRGQGGETDGLHSARAAGQHRQVAPRTRTSSAANGWPPTHGEYRVDLSPATAGPITEVADSTPEDVELALDAAHAAKDAWGEASADPARRGAQRDRRRDRGRTRRCSRSPRAGRTASRSARPSPPTSRWSPTTSGTSPPRRAPRRAARPRSTRTSSPTTSASRSAWSARSSRSTSRC